jgi:tetratricopeptide (TPR) repeat protein
MGARHRAISGNKLKGCSACFITTVANSVYIPINREFPCPATYRTFIEMLNAKLGDAPRGKYQSLGVAWNELGCAWLQSDKPGEAEPCFQKSIEALGALEGATRISISMPLVNIAFAYWLQGRLEEAASTFKEALEDREREFAVNDRISPV